MRYNRYFIDLKQEDNMCNINGKEAIGRCRIEIKNNTPYIYIWLQNLKKDLYSVYLISTKHNKHLQIGDINIDSKSYGELNVEYKSDLNIDDINVVVVTLKNSKFVPLVGYKTTAVDWKSNFNNKKSNSKLHEETQIPHEEIKQEIKKPEPSVETETPHEEIEIENEKTVAEPISDIENEKTNAVTVEKIADEKVDCGCKFNELVKKINDEIQELNDLTFMTEPELIEFNVRNKLTVDDIEYMFANNTPMTPFKNQNKKWIRISLPELINFNINYWEYATHPFVTSAYYNNKHLILSRDLKSDEYILGLPDAYEPGYKAIAAKLGFIQFKACEDKKPMKNDYGYWLMPILL